MKMEGTRTCLVCGTQFPVATAFCPVCMLRDALHEEIKAAEPSPGGSQAESITMGLPPRFEHYELVTDQDGKRQAVHVDDNRRLEDQVRDETELRHCRQNHE